MFGGIPHERIHPHDWRNGVTHVGVIPAFHIQGSRPGKDAATATFDRRRQSAALLIRTPGRRSGAGRRRP